MSNVVFDAVSRISRIIFLAGWWILVLFLPHFDASKSNKYENSILKTHKWRNCPKWANLTWLSLTELLKQDYIVQDDRYRNEHIIEGLFRFITYK